MSKYAYYAVNASNAVAVMTNWNRYLQVRDSFLRNPRCKGFQLYQEAERYALESLEKQFPQLQPPECLAPNFVVYLKRLPLKAIIDLP